MSLFLAHFHFVNEFFRETQMNLLILPNERYFHRMFFGDATFEIRGVYKKLDRSNTYLLQCTSLINLKKSK